MSDHQASSHSGTALLPCMASASGNKQRAYRCSPLSHRGASTPLCHLPWSTFNKFIDASIGIFSWPHRILSLGGNTDILSVPYYATLVSGSLTFSTRFKFLLQKIRSTVPIKIWLLWLTLVSVLPVTRICLLPSDRCYWNISLKWTACLLVWLCDYFSAWPPRIPNMLCTSNYCVLPISWELLIIFN